MESFSKSRPIHWTAVVVTQLFPGHMFSKKGPQEEGDALLLSPAVSPLKHRGVEREGGKEREWGKS